LILALFIKQSHIASGIGAISRQIVSRQSPQVSWQTQGTTPACKQIGSDVHQMGWIPGFWKTLRKSGLLFAKGLSQVSNCGSAH